VGYEPGEHDVLCGRGRKCFNHAGNVKFRAIVQSFLPQYSKAAAKLEKSYILSDVVEQVRKNSGEGGFIKKDSDSGRWYEVGDFLAREKTSQAFRDVLHDKYKSSNTAKKKRRQEEQAEKLFRSSSSRSLDSSSVHSVGSHSSAATGDYMLSDNKLMRMGVERSDSFRSSNLGFGEEEHDDLLGGLDQEIANMGNGAPSRSRRPALNSGSRQGSFRSVHDETNRRAALAEAAGQNDYVRTSCPDIFGNQGRSASAPPISQIEIVQDPSPNNNAFKLDKLDLDHESFAARSDTTAASTGTNLSNNNGGAMGQNNWFQQQQQQQQQQQPGMFGENSASRRHLGHAPNNRLMQQRHPTRQHSGSRNMLAGVQQQIGSLGLNDPPSAAIDPHFSLNRTTPDGISSQGYDFGVPLGLQSHQQGSKGKQGMQGNHQGLQRLGQQGGTGMGGEDQVLMAQLAALENTTGFGMQEGGDENPFEPVPLREG